MSMVLNSQKESMDKESSMDLPSVSIIVPVYNGERFIGQCIESLLALDYPENNREIIIVDNNSKDRTSEIAKKYPVRYLFERKQGPCCARNTGIGNAAFPLIAFTDSDCLADKSWIKELVKAFQKKAVGGCGGHLEPVQPTTVIEEYVIYKEILSQERALRDEAISPPFLLTANAMYRKKILEEAEGFDEEIPVGEDADLSWRVRWKGYSLEYEPRAIVYHHHRSTLWGLLRQIRSYGAGTSYLFRKHHGKLGYETFFNKHPYLEMFTSLFRIPFHLLFGKGRLQKVLPMLEFLGAVFFLTGKIQTSLKLRIRFF